MTPTTMNPPSTKKVYLQTFGCQMNERDSEGVKGLLLTRGYDFTSNIEEAQVILYNTCSVRQHAEDRVFGRSGVLSRIKRDRPETVVGIMGCMAQEHGADFFRRMPSLDLVCGPGNIADIPDLLDRVTKTGTTRLLSTDKINDFQYTMDHVDYREHKYRASVNIMSGCDHKCTYCIVPMTRGIERSRPSQDIVKEIRLLVERGFKDILLLGQNVNCYGKKLDENVDFTELLFQIDKNASPARVRFTTSHPKDAHPRLFEAMRDLPSVCEHLHLPVQSGSNAILRRMKREHTREWYLDRISEYKKIVPNGSITTDIIVGFCGETDADFEETKKLMKEVEYDSSYIFKYSVRPGTPASKLEDNVPEKIKDERLQELLALQKAMTFAKNSKTIGQSIEVLFDQVTSGHSQERCVGRTRTFKRVAVDSPLSLEGQILNVNIQQVVNETLIGSLTPTQNT